MIELNFLEMYVFILFVCLQVKRTTEARVLNLEESLSFHERY